MTRIEDITGSDIVALALSDLRVVQAILKPRARVKALCLRDMEGGRACLAHSAATFDTYLGAIEAGLKRLPELSTHGYRVVRSAA